MMNRRSTLLLALALLGLGALHTTASAQRRQPVSHFESSDFQKIRWLEGRWMGTTPGQAPFYEAYHFANDSTLVVTYFADASFSRATGGARVYLSVAHVYQTAGPARWAATHVDKDGIHFIPLVNAATSIEWTFISPDAWTSTERNDASGREQVTVYQMRRVR